MAKQKKGSAQRAVAQAEFMDAVAFMMREPIHVTRRSRLARVYVWTQSWTDANHRSVDLIWNEGQARFVANLEAPWKGNRTDIMNAMGILGERARPWAGI